MNRNELLDGLRCPNCAHLVDAATQLGGERQPKAGDASVCAYCFSISTFCANGDKLKMVLMTNEEFVELPLEIRTQLKFAQKVAREVSGLAAIHESAKEEA
jgi:hypothetical protein